MEDIEALREEIVLLKRQLLVTSGALTYLYLCACQSSAGRNQIYEENLEMASTRIDELFDLQGVTVGENDA